jgi:hypothetical protein
VPPSPKSQAYEAIVPSASLDADASNEHARFVQSEAKAAVGRAFAGTTTVCVTTAVAPSSSVTVRTTS